MSNDKKQLLNESTVRRFMGLAGIGALTDKFVDEKQLNEQEAPKPEEKPTAGNVMDKITGQPGSTQSALDKIGDLGKRAKQVNEQDEEELPPMPADEPLGAEDDAPVEDIDLTPEEAEVLIGLGQKLAGEMPAEEEAALPDEEMGMPPEEPAPPMPMAEALVRQLTARVSNRLKKEYVVNEVMRRVAGRLKNRR